MKKQLNNINKLMIWCIWPLLLNLVLAFFVFVFTNSLNAKSCFWGGLVAIIPQAVFGFCSFKYTGAQKSKLIWRGFVRGETLKFFFTVLMFAVFYKFLLISTLWFLLAFIIMQFVGFIISCKLLNQ
jgi:F0F1-type ATP synthase assembly protein I